MPPAALDASNIASRPGADSGIIVDTTAVADITLSHTAIDENSPNGTVIGTLSDPGAGGAATFSLLDNAGGRFAVDGDHLVVANYVLLDYEQHASHTIDVQVTESGGLTFDKAFTIDINDVNPENVFGTPAPDHIVGGALGDQIQRRRRQRHRRRRRRRRPARRRHRR